MNIDNLTHEQIQSAANSYCEDEPGFDGAETFPACGSCIVCECRKALSADGGKEDGV